MTLDMLFLVIFIFFMFMFPISRTGRNDPLSIKIVSLLCIAALIYIILRDYIIKPK